MAFLSVEFGVFFLVVAVASFFAEKAAGAGNAPGRAVLLFASVAFYAAADVRFLPVLAYVSLASYVSGRFVRGGRRAFLALFVILELLPLLFLKFRGFFPGGRSGPAFPLGLSFFTLQALSYTIDVFSRRVGVERSFATVALFVGFFPCVTSGPIQRARVLLPELKKRRPLSYDHMTCGMKLFAFGAAKKIIVANALAPYVDAVYADVSRSHGCALFLASVLYSFQIYFDFSGYSDMALGAARFFGFGLERNFDHPYLSRSVGEFWRRWHISLSTWLRDYVYIPLGGNRRGRARGCANLLAVFLVSGVWHGASAHFVLWGLLHGALQCARRLLRPARLVRGAPAWAQVLLTFALVSLAWIFFRVERVSDALLALRKIALAPGELLQFFGGRPSGAAKDALKALFGIGAAVGFLSGFARTLFLLGLFLSIDFATRGADGLRLVGRMPFAARWGLYALLLWSLCYFVLFGGGAPDADFIYNNF